MEMATFLRYFVSPSAELKYRQAQEIERGVAAIRAKCHAESGPWSPDVLIAFAMGQHGLTNAQARQALWHLTGAEELGFRHGLSQVVKC